jgi:hypothetical protein
MANSVFKCPVTGFNIQHELDDDKDVLDNEFRAIKCRACMKVHFINQKTGKLLGQERE